MIEYLYTEGDINAPLKVRLDGKYCGDIKPVEGGWRYFPKGQKEGGARFETVNQIQKSLEEYKPELTDRDQNTLVVLKEVLEKIKPLIFNVDNKELKHEVIMIDSLIKKTLETFKN